MCKATPAPPTPQAPGAATPRASPARGRTPPHPQRDRPGRSGSRGASRCAPASRGWRTQTSANKRVVCKRCGNFGASQGARGPGFWRLRRGREPGLELRRGEEHPPPAPAPSTAVRGSTDFSAGAGLARSPGCALTSLTPAPGATLSAPRNDSTQRETRQKKRKPAIFKIIIIILKRQAQHTRERGPSSPRLRRTRQGLPLGTGPPAATAAARPRVAYCARRGAPGAGPAPSPPALAKSSRLPAARPPRARSPAGAERFVPSGSQGGGNRLVTS